MCKSVIISLQSITDLHIWLAGQELIESITFTFNKLTISYGVQNGLIRQRSPQSLEVHTSNDIQCGMQMRGPDS